MASNRLVAALVALVTLVLTVGGATTGAFWTASESAGAGEIRTGALALRLGDAESQVRDYTFDELTATNMSPGSFAQAPLTLTNTGTTSMTYLLEGWLVSGDVPREHLVLTTTVVDSTLTCPAGGTGMQPGALIDPLAPRPLAPQGEEVWCIRLTLSPEAPQAAAGGVGIAVFTFRGEQVVG